jgi:hypothetical protein
MSVGMGVWECRCNELVVRDADDMMDFAWLASRGDVYVKRQQPINKPANKKGPEILLIADPLF